MDTTRFPEPIAYSINDACQVIGVGRTYLYKMIGDGRLQARKVGKRTLIPAASLRRLIDGERDSVDRGALG